MIGRTIAHYRVTEKLGEGGMGEVYRATDTKLGREVALKVLPEAFASDAERMARFEREAQVLASLNHPNIATIHGLEEADGARCLVLELVEGETLAERISQGPVPLDEALKIARQIAEALEAAHDRGIIHRDLKPSNVKVTPEGRVKVLDFGLAKAFAGEAAEADLSKSPTLSGGATRAGILLGTAAYMSPEQARGKPVDKRTDIWAFGCVLYEMLSGKLAFRGDTASDAIAKILEREADWEALPATTPPAVRRLLRRCLAKDAKLRLRDVGEARVLLDEMAAGEGAPEAPKAPETLRPAGAPAYYWAAAVLLAGVMVTAVLWWNLGPATTPQPVMRFNLPVAPAERLPPFGFRTVVALSPDGRLLAFVGAQKGDFRLYLRQLDTLDATELPSTEGAGSPFFSPDGKSIGFFAEGKLKKIYTGGGTPVVICEAGRVPYGGTWGPDDTIVFNPYPGTGLRRVPASGGTPESLTDGGEVWPEFLPDGKHVLVTEISGSPSGARVGVLSLTTGEKKVLAEGAYYGRFAGSGHLLYVRGDALLAAPFDAKRLEVSGPAVRVLEGLLVQEVIVAAQFALSRNGTLVYVAGKPITGETRLVWADRKGGVQAVPAPPQPYENPHLSPDGRRVAFTMRQGNSDVWVYEFTRGTMSRLTFDPEEDETAVWSPDGLQVAFSAARKAERRLYVKPSDGSGTEELLLRTERHMHVGSWSPDGQLLAYEEVGSATGWDIYVVRVKGEHKPQPFLQTPSDENWPRFSPDGRWIAYVSTESGRSEVYVQPFPGPGGKWQVSNEGGGEQVWARNGKELFYRNGEKMMVVTVGTPPGFSASAPRLLFEGRFETGPSLRPNYDVSLDGQRFLMIQPLESSEAPEQLRGVVNWFDEIRRLTSTSR